MSSGERRLRVAHYGITRVLGEGAVAVVYLAEHRATGRVVAIKTLRPELQADPVARARLELEGRALGRVHGPHLVDALDAGTLEDGAPYLVLEKLEGVSVASYVAAGELPLDAAIAIADSVLDALEALHAAGFVHRDVKPENVVLHSEGELLVPKLLDLGVCFDVSETLAGSPRRTSEGAWVGTPSYLAPEQLAGGVVDPRTDVYGVGALLFECLTGEPPHPGATTQEALTRVVCEPVAPVTHWRPDCPPALEALVAAALSADPRDRPASARSMRDALDAIRGHLELAGGAEALACLDEPRPRTPIDAPTWHARDRRPIYGLGAAILVATALVARAALGTAEAPPAIVSTPLSPPIETLAGDTPSPGPRLASLGVAVLPEAPPAVAPMPPRATPALPDPGTERRARARRARGRRSRSEEPAAATEAVPAPAASWGVPDPDGGLEPTPDPEPVPAPPDWVEPEQAAPAPEEPAPEPPALGPIPPDWVEPEEEGRPAEVSAAGE